jgi:hypothetical protein
MMTCSSKEWTAAQIARALGKRRQTIAEALKGIEPTGTVLASGNAASGWTVASLPQRIQNELAFITAQKGYRSIDAMLSEPPARWAPPISFDSVPAALVDKAVKLHSALHPFLTGPDLDISAAELERRGVETFERVFGYRVTERHWRALVKRTIERDRGFEEWDRVEIYLDEVKAKPAAAPDEVESRIEFAQLDGVINRVRHQIASNAALGRSIWTAAIECLDEQTIGGAHPKRAKRKLLAHLWARAPFLAKSEDSLRKTFDAKFAAWLAAGKQSQALNDGRARSGNHRGPQLTEEEWRVECERLVAYAVAKTEGRVRKPGAS